MASWHTVKVEAAVAAWMVIAVTTLMCSGIWWLDRRTSMVIPVASRGGSGAHRGGVGYNA
ncbi:hypothetical protein SESBI_06501 [Sesbania bispinosa]|nr:hypothetical protein SESBI_06501 [Sesbania bispinosa]